MILPDNGRIVIIDDDINEALPLIHVLSKHKVSASYFDGKLVNLPSEPFNDIRMIFLDIELGTGGQSDKSKVSAVKATLKRIMGEEKYPYILIAWTKHIELVELVKEGIKHNPPIITIVLEKADYKNDDGRFDLEKIMDKLQDDLKEIDFIKVLIDWENTVNSSAGKTIGEFAQHYPYDKNWNKNMKTLFYNMANAYSGKQLEKEFVESSLMTFNVVFTDILENELKSISFPISIDEVEKSLLEPEQIGRINYCINAYKPTNGHVIPGNIYRVGDSPIQIQDLFQDGGKDRKRYENNIPNKNEIQFVLMEVSPKCDYVQNKWKKSRVLPGFICPFEYAKRIKRADYIYVTPLLNVDGVCFKIVFDLRFLTSLDFDELKELSIWICIRHLLLVEIQTHIAKHISRPGVLAVPEKIEKGE